LIKLRYHEYAGLKDYSFGKYINGKLVLTTVSFLLIKQMPKYIDKFSDYRIFRTDGFKHVLYKNGNATVILTDQILQQAI